MSIFQRIGDVFKSNVNDALDKMEDPEKMVKQTIIDMEAQVRTATQALGQCMASEKQAYKQLETAQADSAEWERKAKLALGAGNTDLAKKALAQKVEADSAVSSFQASYDSIHAQTSDLKNKVAGLKSKLDEARTKQNMLIARAKMADAQKDINTSLAGADSSSAFSKLERMERKIEAQEAEAQAFADIADGGDNALDDEFAALEANSGVDAELARLMAEMKGGE